MERGVTFFVCFASCFGTRSQKKFDGFQIWFSTRNEVMKSSAFVLQEYSDGIPFPYIVDHVRVRESIKQHLCDFFHGVVILGKYVEGSATALVV